MNVFITGGCGFIGSHLAERLIARGDRVLVGSYVESHPGLLSDPGSLADLIHGEFLLRQARGETPRPACRCRPIVRARPGCAPR